MIKHSILLGLSLASPALAQQAPQPDAAADPAAAKAGRAAGDRAGTIIVTATRAAVPIDRVASSVTVLDKAAIDRAQDLAVSDLVLRTPGTTLTRNGGYGTVTSLRIRGAESDQTVVVIDGVKLNDPSAPGGGYNFANLMVGDASRIEVLRGPQSILWGSQAIGGVVNVVTALPERALEGSFDVEAGSRQTASGRVAVGGRTGPLAWRIGGQAFTTAGISAIAPAFGGVEKDGFTNRSVTGRAVLDLAPGISADVRGYYSNAHVELDGFNADSADYSLNREFVGYAGLNADLLDGRLRNRIAYGYTDTDRDNYNPTRARPLSFNANGRNERIEYQGSFAITPKWNAVFGAENERSHFHSVAPSASLAVAIPAAIRGRARLTGVYGEINGEVIDGLTLTGGIRHDDHSRFGSKTLFAGGGVWVLPTGTVIRASYAEGFKAPTLYQLFSEYGNDGLRPEQAHGWEAGAEQRLLDGMLSAGATYFERRTRDQINFFSCSGTSTDPLCFTPGTTVRRFGYYQNINHALARGIEASVQLRPAEGLLIDGNYSWIQSEDRSAGATYGFQLARRPKHLANASASYTLPDGLSLGVAARWSGRAFDNAAHTVVLDNYTLVDLRGELPIKGGLRLFARVENLFDETYSTAYRYGALGRSYYAGFRGRF